MSCPISSEEQLLGICSGSVSQKTCWSWELRVRWSEPIDVNCLLFSMLKWRTSTLDTGAGACDVQRRCEHGKGSILAAHSLHYHSQCSSRVCVPRSTFDVHSSCVVNLALPCFFVCPREHFGCAFRSVEGTQQQLWAGLLCQIPTPSYHNVREGHDTHIRGHGCHCLWLVVVRRCSSLFVVAWCWVGACRLLRLFHHVPNTTYAQLYAQPQRSPRKRRKHRIQTHSRNCTNNCNRADTDGCQHHLFHHNKNPQTHHFLVSPPNRALYTSTMLCFVAASTMNIIVATVRVRA